MDDLINNRRVYDYRELVDVDGYPIYDAPDELDIVSLFYDIKNNKFVDEGGYIIWDIFKYITPNDLYLFRKNKECMFVPYQTAKGWICELYYPSEGDKDYDM